MADEFKTNKQPGFHILISLIEIWTPKDKRKPNESVDESNIMRICEVEQVEIEESYKKLVGTASVRFPRGTVIRRTIWGKPEDREQEDEEGNKYDPFKAVTASVSESGVVETVRTETSVASTDIFKVGQRIKIYLGYTTDPQIAELAKTGGTGKTIYNDKDSRTKYKNSFGFDSAKKYTNLMFDGFITKVSLDTPIELECENLASVLKTITCPKVKLKKCEVKDFLGEKGSYKMLQDTGLILHPDTAGMDFGLGAVELSTDLTVADVLMEWSKYGLFCYVSDYNGQPAIQIGRAYFSNPGKDSILNANTTSQPVPIYFDYHVANNGLGLTSSDKDFLAVGAKGIDSDDKFINITVLRNPKFDPTKDESDTNPKYRYVNETKLSKKALKAGKRYLTDAPNDKVDMKLYTKIAFVSKKAPVTKEQLAEEAIKYLEGFNMTGIEGSLSLFGDLCLRTAQQVELIDNRYPGKNGIYLVEEVHTTFGVDGFRQRISLPYCIRREGNQSQSG